jgi:TRAP-type C4-dicarboxylate transport system permease small subunit
MKKLIEKLSQATLMGMVYAQDQIELQPPTGFENLAKISLPGLISTGIKLVLVVAALISFIFLVYGGIRWITSQGDKERMTAAQSTITAALVGLIVVFAAWAIMKLLEAFFGITILSELKIPEVPID